MPTDSDTYAANPYDVAADYSSAAHNRAKPQAAPPGPVKKPAVTTIATSSKGSTYDLSGFTAGAIAEAEQEATDFASWLGWPAWFDWNSMVKGVLQMDIQKDPQKVYEFLWTQLGEDKQKANMNAYFGLTSQQYLEKSNNLKDIYHLYTGGTDVPDDFRNKALKENWTQSEMMTALQADPKIGATAPWLAAGQSFRDVASQFSSQYGIKQDDPQQLASWWKFRSGAQAVGTAGPATEVQHTPPTRAPGADVAVR